MTRSNLVPPRSRFRGAGWTLPVLSGLALVCLPLLATGGVPADPAAKSCCNELSPRLLTTSGPLNVRLAAVAFDSVIGGVMFGGYDGAGNPTADTWVWDSAGNSWTRATPSTLPPARASAGMAASRALGGILLFGGTDGSSLLNDTWLWDGTDWQQLGTRAMPAMRNMAMATDMPSQMIVMYGGRTNTGQSSSTWRYDPTPGVEDWVLIDNNSPPGSRAYAAMAWCTSIQKLVLFGGLQSSSHWKGDTWTYDAGAGVWAHLNISGPPARGSMVLVPGLCDDVLLYGGGTYQVTFDDCWEFDGAAWHTGSYQPYLPLLGPRTQAGGFHDPWRGNIVLVGGGYGDPGTNSWRFAPFTFGLGTLCRKDAVTTQPLVYSGGFPFYPVGGAVRTIIPSPPHYSPPPIDFTSLDGSPVGAVMVPIVDWRFPGPNPGWEVCFSPVLGDSIGENYVIAGVVGTLAGNKWFALSGTTNNGSEQEIRIETQLGCQQFQWEYYNPGTYRWEDWGLYPEGFTYFLSSGHISTAAMVRDQYGHVSLTLAMDDGTRHRFTPEACSDLLPVTEVRYMVLQTNGSTQGLDCNMIPVRSTGGWLQVTGPGGVVPISGAMDSLVVVLWDPDGIHLSIDIPESISSPTADSAAILRWDAQENGLPFRVELPLAAMTGPDIPRQDAWLEIAARGRYRDTQGQVTPGHDLGRLRLRRLDAGSGTTMNLSLVPDFNAVSSPAHHLAVWNGDSLVRTYPATTDSLFLDVDGMPVGYGFDGRTAFVFSLRWASPRSLSFPGSPDTSTVTGDRVTVAADSPVGAVAGLESTILGTSAGIPALRLVLADTVSTGAPDGGNAVPAAPALAAPVPNPFNPQARLSFRNREEGPVDVTVYDLRGRLVRRLLDGAVMPAGRVDVTWDGRDAAGGEVPAGVYLFRVRTPAGSASAKGVLVR